MKRKPGSFFFIFELVTNPVTSDVTKVFIYTPSTVIKAVALSGVGHRQYDLHCLYTTNCPVRSNTIQHDLPQYNVLQQNRFIGK